MDLRESSSAGGARHPWEVARSRFLLRALRDAEVLERPATFLDVGAGDTWFARQLLDALPEGSEAVCWDANFDDEALRALGHGVRLVRDRPEGSFDLVTLLDVLEHVEDDGDFLRAIVAGNLKPGGRALVTVPAWPALFSQHDVALHHFRRYTPTTGARLLEGAGLRILARGGLFHGLVAPRAAVRLREAIVGGRAVAEPESRWRAGPLVTAAVSAVLAVDGAASRAFSRAGVEVPGLSWWALCTR